MASRTRVTVDRGAIYSMFLPSGEVGIERDRIRYWAAAYARAAVRSRTGALRRSIRSDRRGSGRTQARFTVWTTSPYGWWVHEGTTGPIRPKRGRAMVLYQTPRVVPGRWARYQHVLKKRVDGQRGRPFLERGMHRAMRRFGYAV